MMQAGWDWASESHHVSIVDEGGVLVDAFEVEHSEQGLSKALGRLSRYAHPADLPVAIERPSGLVVERLLEAGFPVVPIHPNTFNAARPRWGASGSKSDPKDSFCLADFLRTDGHRLRWVKPLTPDAQGLRALSRLRDDHVAAKVAAANRLGALLEAHWPGAGTIFSRLDSAIALAFLNDYPTPESAARLGPARMEMFCRRHSYSGNRTPKQLLERLQKAPAAPAVLDRSTLAGLIRAQVRLLSGLLETITELDRLLTAAAMGSSKGQLLKNLPRIGEINLAQVVGEVGPILERSVDCEHACAEIGAAPVTKKSGKVQTVTFRWAANAQARKALSTFADNSRHSSPWAADLYRRARLRGKRHPEAIRILMRAWLRVIWACWHSEVAYDPVNHGGERRIVDQTGEKSVA